MIYIPADLVLLLSTFDVQHHSFTKAKCQFLCTKLALWKWVLNFLLDNPSSVLAFLGGRPALLLFTHMHVMYTQWISQALILSHMEINISSKRGSSSFTFWRLHPQKYPPAPKNKTLLTKWWNVCCTSAWWNGVRFTIQKNLCTLWRTNIAIEHGHL